MNKLATKEHSPTSSANPASITPTLKLTPLIGKLPEILYQPQQPTPVKNPQLLRLNPALAETLNLDISWLLSKQAVQTLAGNYVPPHMSPVACAYAGHQFGMWNPSLGDGRVVNLGVTVDQHGHSHEVQLKGAGDTPFSRMGDGRAPLGPVLREYVMSEALHHLGIPTTRALACATSGEKVVRERLLPGAILTRTAKSFLRVGTFEYLAHHQAWSAMEQTINYVIEQVYPDLQGQPLSQLLARVVDRQAFLIAKWQAAGFIHGVMNTDNMLLSGETVDYGPCAFLDQYRPEQHFSAIDQHGRYAFQHQPTIAQWNLARLADSLLPLLTKQSPKALTQAQRLIESFPKQFEHYYHKELSSKLGFRQSSPESRLVAEQWLAKLRDEKSDYTQSFYSLAKKLDPQKPENKPNLSAWEKDWKKALLAQGVNFVQAKRQILRHNPNFTPRNHLIEHAIDTATRQQDFSLFHTLVELGKRPFNSPHEEYCQPPTAAERVTQTFCGT